MDEIKLPLSLKLAVEALAVTAGFRPGSGWEVSLQSRRQAGSWGDGYAVTYDNLTTAELLDVLYVELEHALSS